ncbi:hypothetical protein OGM63_14190 [Plectonema radiosum NIES-515]|uniref:Lipoprotein n=1 Tax=Plectonema radiosum NIES-515 TaxID=2986073 RepID=A0ABT3B0Y4_9CYAN|nr:choice-of-anchor tandem repeat NxxGxxAF-containing protein [Plectonema radiosum]MCV3214650.1 hypothetical protein [Plectonema radiosum NIES-515]
MIAIKRFSVATAVCLSLSLLVTSEAFACTYTKIADSNDPLFNSFGSSPTINNQDTVVFSANLVEGKATGIYISRSGVTTNIANNNSPFSLFENTPTITDAGTLPFQANLNTIGSGIFTVENEVVTTIAESSQPRGVYQDPVINNNGAVAFLSNVDNVQKILLYQVGVTTPIADTNIAYRQFNGYSINDLGIISFSASLKTGGSGIFTVDSDGATTTIVDSNTTIDSSDDSFSFLYPPVMNNSGSIAFHGVLKGLAGEGIYTVSAGNSPTKIVDNRGPFDFFENPAINDAGQVAFKAILDDGTVGIFKGSDPVADKVIAVGDNLCGSNVKNLFFSKKGLNNTGKFVFYAQFENGTSGIYILDPSGEDNHSC